jgi:hypothetical protein
MQELILSLSLDSCNLLPLAYKRESRGPFQGTSSDLLTVTSSFSSREESPPSTSSCYGFYELQRLGTELPLSPICNPYYKSAQIIQRRELDVGCYSLEARTSIKYCVPPICTTVRGLTRNPRNLLPSVRELRRSPPGDDTSTASGLVGSFSGKQLCSSDAGSHKTRK